MTKRTQRLAAALATLLAVTALGAGSVSASTFGINAHIPTNALIDKTTDAGIAWVRVDFVWAFVELDSDLYWWDLYDTLIDNLEARGVRIFATVGGTPSWATSGGEFSGVPDDPAEWKEFCYRAASRYRGRIDAWGFWNEPNLGHFWEGDRWAYINDILIPGIEAVRRADPGALTVGPELAHLNSGDWDDWLDDVITEVRVLLDVVSHHVYPSDGSAGNVTEKLIEGGLYPWDPPSVRSVLDDAGWRYRPFWLTETGVQSDVEGEVGQERFYRDLLNDWFGENPNHRGIDRIFFYELADPGNNPALSWGILESPPEYGEKLAYSAYSNFIDGAAVDDAEIVIHGVPRSLGSRETAALEFEVTNTGTTTWTTEDAYLLNFSAEGLGWNCGVEPVTTHGPVAPGQTVWLTGSVESGLIFPRQPNATVHLYARMEKTGVARFGNAPYPSVIHTAYSAASIVEHPIAAVVPYNGTVSFSIEAVSDTAISYQWRRDTVALSDDFRISGSDTATLMVSGVGFEELGDYDCVISNAAGPLLSDPATLTLAGSPIRRADGRRQPFNAPSIDRWLRFRADRAERQSVPTGRDQQGPRGLTANDFR